MPSVGCRLQARCAVCNVVLCRAVQCGAVCRVQLNGRRHSSGLSLLTPLLAVGAVEAGAEGACEDKERDQ